MKIPFRSIATDTCFHPQKMYIPSPTRLTKYFILFSTYLGWSDAREYCRTRGGDLATIANSDESSTVVRALNEFGGPVINAWIGLNDIAQESSFTWVDGSPTVYRNFLAWQPDSNRGAGDENCIEMNKNEGWKWNDLLCTEKLAVLCATCNGAACTPEVRDPCFSV
jgi:hypothetical protein